MRITAGDIFNKLATPQEKGRGEEKGVVVISHVLPNGIALVIRRHARHKFDGQVYPPSGDSRELGISHDNKATFHERTRDYTSLANWFNQWSGR